jgi:hypothetical protein
VHEGIKDVLLPSLPLSTRATCLAAFLIRRSDFFFLLPSKRKGRLSKYLSKYPNQSGLTRRLGDTCRTEPTKIVAAADCPEIEEYLIENEKEEFDD